MGGSLADYFDPTGIPNPAITPDGAGRYNAGKYNPQWSPDGRSVCYCQPIDGIMYVWVKDLPNGEARPVAPCANYTRISEIQSLLVVPEHRMGIPFWNAEGEIIFFREDADAPNLNLFKADPKNASAEPVFLASIPRVSRIYGDPNGRNEMLIGIHNQENNSADVVSYRLEKQAKPEIVAHGQEGIADWVVLNSEVRLAIGVTTELQERCIYRFEPDTLVPIYTVQVQSGTDSGIIGFHEDGRSIYIINSTDEELEKLQLLDTQTGETTDIEYGSDPAIPAEGRKVDFGRYTGVVLHKGRLFAIHYIGDLGQRWFFTDPKMRDAFEQLSRHIDSDKGNIWIAFQGAVKLDDDGNIDTFVFMHERDVDPGTFYAYQVKTNQLTTIGHSHPNLDPDEMAHQYPICYKNRKGKEIFGFITIPQGIDPQNLALVVMPHCGSLGRDIGGQNLVAQWFARELNAVSFTCNYGGSGGYGRKFQQAGNVESIMEDIEDGMEYLTKHSWRQICEEQGIEVSQRQTAFDESLVDRDRMVGYGFSFGGAAVLCLMARGRLKGAVSQAGPEYRLWELDIVQHSPEVEVHDRIIFSQRSEFEAYSQTLDGLSSDQKRTLQEARFKEITSGTEFLQVCAAREKAQGQVIQTALSKNGGHILIIQGDEDDNVVPAIGSSIARLLHPIGLLDGYLLVKGVKHEEICPDSKQQKAMMAATVQHLGRQLGVEVRQVDEAVQREIEVMRQYGAEVAKLPYSRSRELKTNAPVRETGSEHTLFVDDSMRNTGTDGR